MFQVRSLRLCTPPAAALLLVGVSACSTPATPIPAALIGDKAFANMSCKELRVERNKHVTALNDLNHPPLFPSKSEGERRKEVSREEGEIKVMETVEAQKNCAAAGNSWASHASF